MSSVKTVAAFAAGVVLSYFHWVGLIIGGALLGFTAKKLRYAISLGLLLGAVVWLLFAAQMVYSGVLDRFLHFPLSYVSLLLSVAASTLASSLRALIT